MGALEEFVAVQELFTTKLTKCTKEIYS